MSDGLNEPTIPLKSFLKVILFGGAAGLFATVSAYAVHIERLGLALFLGVSAGVMAALTIALVGVAVDQPREGGAR